MSALPDPVLAAGFLEAVRRWVESQEQGQELLPRRAQSDTKEVQELVLVQVQM
ncbi:hypothetical protein CCP3SC15_450020 [Gammaproteobacteria bacterium]